MTQLLPPPVDDKVLEPAPEPVVVGWRKFVTKKAFKSYAFLICYLGAQFFFVYVLPRIGSRMFLDIFWGALISAMVFCVSGCVSCFALDFPHVYYLPPVGNEYHHKSGICATPYK